MAGRRLLYLAGLAGCLVFYGAYQQWFSWFALVGVACLPWFSLLVSLPAMVTTRVGIRCAASTTVGGKEQMKLSLTCRFPTPAVKCRIRITRTLTGEQWRKKTGDRLPTDHCGALTILPEKAWVYDYLGLFRLPVRKKNKAVLLVRPEPVGMENPPDISRYLANSFKPKPGGGFGENHELRLYRPGDNLQQIHWKLTAKTGKLILRETMEPIRGKALLTMALTGSGAELDRKLGRLLWLSGYLLSREMPHEIACITGSGLLCYQVKTEADAQAAVDALLNTPAAGPGTQEPNYPAASWRYHVGGGSDEET